MSNTVTTTHIDYAAAAHAVGVAIEEGAKAGFAVCASVVDPALGLVAYGRANGTPPHSIETSRRKANTAASTKKPSAALPEEFRVGLEHGTGGILTGLPGGVPLQFEGTHAGGLGIAGAPPAKDAEIAAAVLARIGADAVQA